MESGPLILCPPPFPARLTWTGRLGALAIATACLAVLLTAVHIHPSPYGIGTHQQLGLKPCEFESRTGVPCPTCGMTTSFAHFVRGQWVASLYIQPCAAFLALATCVLTCGAIYVALTARPIHRLLHPRFYLLALLGLAILGWMWKIWIHSRGIDGWR